MLEHLVLESLIIEAVRPRITPENVQDIYKSYVEVESSNVHALWYDPEEKIMRVRFKGDNKEKGQTATFGAEYEYYRVPERIFIRLLNAPSHGSAFWKLARTVFEYKRIQDWDESFEDDFDDIDIDSTDQDLDFGDDEFDDEDFDLDDEDLEDLEL